MIGIYKITSPSGKVYIGQSIDIKQRFMSYKRLHKTKGQVRLYRSFIKYGLDNHIFDIVDICSINQLNTKERYWQLYYNSTSRKGLNCILTGANGRSGKHSASTIEKIRLSSTGRLHSKATKEFLSNHFKNRVFSNETKKKMSDSAKTKKISSSTLLKYKRNAQGCKNSNAKIVLNTETGVYYDYCKDAAESIGIKYNTLVCMLCGKNPNKTSMVYA